MRFMEIIHIAIDSLVNHKTRALLTMLGIIIGVGAVISMVAVGQGAQTAVEQQIASLGTNVLIVFPSSITQGGVRSGAGATTTLTTADVQAIREQCPAIAYASPMVRTARQVVAGHLNWNTSIQGGSPDYFQIRDWPLATGRYFTEEDERGMAKVCLLGQTVVQNLFPNQNPIGQVIRIGNLPFFVIGTLASKGQTSFGQDQDDIIIAPFATVQREVLGIDYVSIIIVSAVSNNVIPTAQQQVSNLLRVRHHLQSWEENDFTIRTQTEIATAFTATSRVMTILLASIASVSLLVGGIGIMNIMLVSVTERTREIGIRISIGARTGDILTQFLVEAIVMSLLGGVIGILLGVLGSSLVSKLAGWPTFVTSNSILLAVVFSTAVGVFFGYYPARKASRLNPIEALRYE
jgi:putative ABC transport system permease protein